MAIEEGLVSFEPSRRAVVRAAAWTAPAIVLAQSVPAQATSGLIEVDAFAVTGTCYSRTERGQAYELRMRWEFTIGSSGLPAGTTIIIETTGSVYNHSYQVSGGTIQQVGSSVESAGKRTSTYTLTAPTYSLTRIITGFYKHPTLGGPGWTCTVNIILPTGYIAAPGSAPYASVVEATPNTLVCV